MYYRSEYRKAFSVLFSVCVGPLLSYNSCFPIDRPYGNDYAISFYLILRSLPFDDA